MRKTYLIFFLFLCFCDSLFAQEYKKDTRPQSKVEDIFNSHGADKVSKYEIIRALELAGVRIHKFTLAKFEKKQSILIMVDEYVGGEIVSTQKIFDGDNTYIYFTDSIPTDDTIPYVDYLDQLVFYTKESKDDVLLTASTYNGNYRATLEKRNLRKSQSYHWRSYGKVAWEVNEKIPLFIYASSWEENNSTVERFCGVADLSFDQEAAQELLYKSPHYFLISCTISE